MYIHTCTYMTDPSILDREHYHLYSGMYVLVQVHLFSFFFFLFPFFPFFAASFDDDEPNRVRLWKTPLRIESSVELNYRNVAALLLLYGMHICMYVQYCMYIQYCTYIT